MNKITWYSISAIAFLIGIIFLLLLFGSLTDIKYEIESFAGISNKIIALCYKFVYSFSVIIIIQFLFIVYLLFKIRK